MNLRRFVISFLIGFAVLYAGFGTWLYFSQRSILFVPDTRQYEPADANLPEMETKYFQTADGVIISGWYKAAPEGRPTILYFHGNGGSNRNHSGNADEMIAAGYGLLILEYRGYGGNPGTPSQEGFYNDGRAAITFLKSQGVSEGDIILFGYSLGTGVAIKMATEISAKALILQAPYTSISDVAQNRYWYMPVSLLIQDPFPALDLIDKVSEPTLYQYGTADRVIPPAFTKQLLEADRDPKTVAVFEGLGHLDLGAPDVVAEVFRLLDNLE